MKTSKEHFGYDDAARARDYVGKVLEGQGLKPGRVRDCMILGSGLGGFTKKHMDRGAVRIPFKKIFAELGIEEHEGEVHGHARELVIGPLKNTSERRLVAAQSGREHPYEGIDTRRATFWLRVMQLFGVETLFGSNAAGIITPRTLKVPSLMLINGHSDQVGDNPLVGINEPKLGPRFPHMGNYYPAETRELVQEVVRRLGFVLSEGILMRTLGPNYESADTIYELRELLGGIWRRGNEQYGERRFINKPTGLPVGAVGMSTTYEAIIAQHATLSKANPAFQRGRVFVSALTNYAAALGPEGFVNNPNHKEVKRNAAIVEEMFGSLAREVILEMRKAA